MSIPFSESPLVYTDELSRRLYANDASMYEELPLGVTFPRDASEIKKIIVFCAQNSIPITARSAGTSLAGQTTGAGLIMDVSRYMTRIKSIDIEKKRAIVEPGVIRDTLNREAAKHDLLFGPDTSTTNRCMLGGMIGNNSSGSFSIKYGSTREQLESIDVVLSDGSETILKPLSREELEEKRKLDTLEGSIYNQMIDLLLEYKALILASYPHPEIIRRNTGYALDKLCQMDPITPGGRPFNLAELVCGSEGTLTMTTKATVKLSKKDKYSILLVPQFNTLYDSLIAAVEAVKFDPAAVELMDRIILDATKGNTEQRKNRFFLEGEPETVLMIQFDGEDLGELVKKAKNLANILADLALGYTHPIITDPDLVSRVFELRKAGLGLLMGLASDEKTPTFVEDTAVRVEDLPDYIDEFREILSKYGTHCVFYAHASVGELHLRPKLNIKTQEGIEKMKAMAEEVALLVKKYRGSLSGEHGDGRTRAPYIRYVLGDEMMPVLEKVKEIWDPKGIFNPGKIVNAKPIDADLRYSPKYQSPKVDTVFHYRKEGGFAEAIEQCNGAGVCRKLAESGGTMCPSYMATKDEKDSTRGRANLFRQLFSGKQVAAFESEDLKQVLDLCLSCKACKSECPANVDMAKMKAEFLQGYHDKKGTPLSYRFFGNPGSLFSLAQLFPRLTNTINHSGFGKYVLNRFLNVSKERNLPNFTTERFTKRVKKRNPIKGANNSLGKVVLLIDLYIEHNEPELGLAALHVLEHLGYDVILTQPMEAGRTQLSKGFLRKAKKIAEKNISLLSTYTEKNIPIVGLEPSELLTLRDEYLDLVNADLMKKAESVANQSFMFEEFINKHLLEHQDHIELFKQSGEDVLVHGHCHAKSQVGVEPTLEMMKHIGLKPIDLKTGCCGMAGSFGYEADHYSLSMEIGELVLFPKLKNSKKGTLICVPGFSCRHQILDGTSRIADHPAIIAERMLKE